MGIDWVVLPVVGSLIGWLTNYVAIRMLFRPKKPLRVFGVFALQGVLPRRQPELARVVGETVERHLLPVDELVDRLDIGRYQVEAVDAVVAYVDQRMEQNLPDVLPRQVRRIVADFVKRMVEKEAGQVIDALSQKIKARVQEDVHLGDLVRDKLNELDTDELEGIVVRVARTELRAIEVLGAILGGVIGVAQAALLTLLQRG